jgi:predicted permease
MARFAHALPPMGDLRHAFRTLRKQRGFTAVAILTLAFGIGVNASLFSMVSAFFLQPLPVKDPQQLVLVMQRGDVVNIPYGQSYPDYLDYRRETKTFSGLVAYMPVPVHLSARGQTPERTWIEVVSPNYFALAGAAPAFGEFPQLSRDEQRGAAPSVVLSYRYWQRRFGGDPSVVGQSITLNRKTFTVTGIAPASFTGFAWAMAVSAFVPSGSMGSLMNGGDAFREDRGAPAFRMMGRLAPGKTIDAARAEMETIAQRLVAAYPAEHKGTRILLIPENRARPDPAVSGFLPIFAIVFSALVALVLLIACANVANLMLSRALQRQRDLVIRSALGASRFRLIRLQVVESLVLAGIAGGVGILLAQWAGAALAGFVPAGDIPMNQDRPWDWRISAFTVVASVIAGLATGLWPARAATRFDLVQSLKDGRTTAGAARHTLRNLLVIGQVTMSVVVLAGAGLFLHSLQRLQNVALGFRADGLVMASVDLGLQQYSDQRGLRFIEDLLTRAEALPGVTSATALSHVPFDYGMLFSDVSTEREIPGAKDGYISTAFDVVGPRFFETAEVPLVRGRALDRSDTGDSRRVAVVNQMLAATLWPGEDPIGRRFRFGRNGGWVEVVGVARDGKYVMLAEQPRPYVYLPLAQHYQSPITIIARCATDPAVVAQPLQRLVGQMDPDLPVFNVRTMDTHMRTSVFALLPFRMGATLAAAQGLIGLLLAVMGLYAVVSYAVARRTREIGVRLALGAARTDVVRLVVREGMWLAAIGVALGLVIALGLGLVLSKVLYGVPTADAGVMVSVAAVLLAVSALACYVPASRATRIDPIAALRHD